VSSVILRACIDSDEIIHALMELSQEEILEFFKEVDDTVGDWDFTRLVRDFFVEEMEKVDEDD
jgi:hypothetical protein